MRRTARLRRQAALELPLPRRDQSRPPLWRTNTSKVPPYGRGGFFSSPAVAFGKVYAARDDGAVYAYDEKTGKVEWRRDVGGPVPGTAVVIGRTVYTSCFKTKKTIDYDALTHKDLRARHRRLHADDLRRETALCGRLLHAGRARAVAR